MFEFMHKLKKKRVMTVITLNSVHLIYHLHQNQQVVRSHSSLLYMMVAFDCSDGSLPNCSTD